MDNKHPKSENPAMKEHAAQDKNLAALQKSTAAEKAARRHPPHAAEAAPKPK